LLGGQENLGGPEEVVLAVPIVPFVEHGHFGEEAREEAVNLGEEEALEFGREEQSNH